MRARPLFWLIDSVIGLVQSVIAWHDSRKKPKAQPELLMKERSQAKTRVIPRQ